MSIDKWRSETLTALTTGPKFEHHQAKVVQQIFSHAERAILPWILNRSAFKRHEAVLRQEIFEPAVKLHQAIRTSVRQYDMSRSDRQYYMSGPAPNGSCTLRDIGTWKKVEKVNEIEGGIYCLYPAIVWRGVGDKDTDTELVKPVLVVNLPILSREQTVTSVTEVNSARVPWSRRSGNTELSPRQCSRLLRRGEPTP